MNWYRGGFWEAVLTVHADGRLEANPKYTPAEVVQCLLQKMREELNVTDYRELLKRYMRMVIEAEGAHFINEYSQAVTPDDDTAELLRIYEEIKQEWI